MRLTFGLGYLFVTFLGLIKCGQTALGVVALGRMLPLSYRD